MFTKYAFSGKKFPARSVEVRAFCDTPETDVKFHGKEDLAKFTTEIAKHRGIRVVAALGSGKTTRLPYQLASSGNRVILVQPNVQLAHVTHEYLRQQHKRDATMISRDPREGGELTIVSAGELCGFVARDNDLLRDACVYLDEAHDLNAWTHVLEKVSIPLGAKKLLRASGTFDQGGSLRRSGAGTKTEDMALPPVARWGQDMPWTDNHGASVLFISDSASSRRDMLAKMTGGYRRFDLDSRTPGATVAEALHAAATGHSVAIAADSTYRTGFTIDVRYIVDDGLVRSWVTKDGKYVPANRRATVAEVEQTKARGGRGKFPCSYYRCATHAEIDDDLDERHMPAPDVDAAAVLLQALGFPLTLETYAAETADLIFEDPLAVMVATAHPLTYPYQESDSDVQTKENSTFDAMDFLADFSTRLSYSVPEEGELVSFGYNDEVDLSVALGMFERAFSIAEKQHPGVYYPSLTAETRVAMLSVLVGGYNERVYRCRAIRESVAEKMRGDISGFDKIKAHRLVTQLHSEGVSLQREQNQYYNHVVAAADCFVELRHAKEEATRYKEIRDGYHERIAEALNPAPTVEWSGTAPLLSMNSRLPASEAGRLLEQQWSAVPATTAASVSGPAPESKHRRRVSRGAKISPFMAYVGGAPIGQLTGARLGPSGLSLSSGSSGGARRRNYQALVYPRGN